MDDSYLPTASTQSLVFRANWIRQLREWFWQQGFMEVETPVLSWDSVIDRHLDPIAVPVAGITGVSSDARMAFLQTSPEFGMKRLLASGLDSIFQITRAFRSSERGQWHNPEFTMAEWYRVGDDYEQGIKRLEALAFEMFPMQRALPSRRWSYRDLFIDLAGVDPFEKDDRLFWDSILKELSSCEPQCDSRQWDRSDRQAALDFLFDWKVQGAMRSWGVVIVHDYPAEQSALAQIASRDYGRVAERFELFVQGIELANGYHELLSADELRGRNVIANRQRAEDGKPVLPESSRLLTAMEQGLPACAGVALGVDRAVAVACGATSIEQVLAFPWERA